MTLKCTEARKHVQWSLLLNSHVEIRKSGQVVRSGFVDDVMPDSSALWLASDATLPRQLFETSEGHEVWLMPRELDGDLTYRMTTKHIFGGLFDGKP